MKQKIKEKSINKIPLEPLKNIGIYTLYLLFGFVLTFSEISDGLKPFAVSFTAVSKKKGYIFSSLGGIMGYLVFGLDTKSAGYFCAVIIVGVVAFFCDILKANNIIYIPVISAGLSLLVVETFINLKLSCGVADYLLSISESILASGGSFIYFKALNVNYKSLRFKAIADKDLMCITLSIMTIFLSIGKLGIGYIYPFRIVMMIFSLFLIRCKRENIGILLSLILGFICENDEPITLCGAIGICSLVSVLLNEKNSVNISIGYVLTVSFFSIIIGGEDGFSLFLDGLISNGIFLLTPNVISEKIESILEKKTYSQSEGNLRQNIVLKLRFASCAMAAISDSVEQVRERIIEIERKNNEKNKELLTEEEYITNQIILEKANQIRMVASDQFFSISDMLKDLAEEFSEAETFDFQSEEKINALLNDINIFPSNISAIIDKYNRMRVEILLENTEEMLDLPYLQKEIGKVCSRYFDKIKVTTFSSETMLSLNERPNYSLNIGFAQHSAQGKLCGDTVKIINDNKGHSILIISDGMGKGGRAALDGAWVLG